MAGGDPPSKLCLLLVRHSTATARLGGFDMSSIGLRASQYSPMWYGVVVSTLKTVWGDFMWSRNMISCSFVVSGT